MPKFNVSICALWKKIKNWVETCCYFIGLKDGALDINLFHCFLFLLYVSKRFPFFYNFPRLGNNVCEFFFCSIFCPSVVWTVLRDLTSILTLDDIWHITRYILFYRQYLVLIQAPTTGKANSCIRWIQGRLPHQWPFTGFKRSSP